MKKHVIIGAGISGISLAYHLQKLNKKDEIVIIDKNFMQSTSYHSNNLYFTQNEKNKKFSLSIKKLSPIFLFHFLCIQIIFFFYINNVNKYFSKLNFLPLSKKKCNNIQYYDLQKYRDFVHSFQIIKDEYISFHKHNNINVKTKNNKNINCDFLYDCRAFSNNSHFLLNVSSDSIYLEVDEMKIKCLVRDDIYWFMPLNHNTIKVSMHLYVNFNDKLNKKKIDIDKISQILKEKYNIKILKIKDKWYGSRTCSYDLLPYYYQKEDNVFVITGGSFLGFNILPAISREIAYKVNRKKMQKYKYDLSINRIYKELFFLYMIITLFIYFFINKYYKK